MSADEIFIQQLIVETIIGVLPHERCTLQPIELDIVLMTNISVAAESENLADTLDYAAIATGISDYVKKTQFLLIETLAESIVKWLWAFFPAINQVSLVLRKPMAVSTAKTVGLKIKRRRPSLLATEQ
jgi:dihydroneopterin aldolase